MGDVTMVALRFALFVDLMAVFGVAAFGLYVLPSTERGATGAIPFAPVLGGGALAGIALSAVAIVATAAQMSGSELTNVAFVSVRMLVCETPVGLACCVRVACLVGMAALTFAGHIRLTAIAGLGFMALATLAWSGHGAMQDGVLGWIYLSADIAHLAAAGVWIGALPSLLWLLVTVPSIALLHRALDRFATFGTIVVLILFASGLVNGAAILGWPLAGDLLASDYGRLLALKLALFVAMLGVAALNRFRLVPRLAERDGDVSMRALRISIALEATVALMILALVAWLGTLAPPS